MRIVDVIPKIKIHWLALVVLSITNALLCQPAIAKDWQFDVYLDQTKIGQHTFKLNPAATELTSVAKFNVKILFFNAYQYDHNAKEKWQGDCLTSLDATTIEDSVATKVIGQLSTKNLVVDDGKNKQNLPVCSMTFAYWNPKILTQSQLLNPQNAEWLDTKFTKLGVERIEIKGQKLDATHYQLEGSLAGKNKLKIELWYTNNNDWVALKSTTETGDVIQYKLR